MENVAVEPQSALSEEALYEKIKEGVRKELEPEYSAKLAKDIADYRAQLTVENERAINQALDEFKKSMAPPTTEEIQKLLDQEYATFKIKLFYNDAEKEFVIKELPQKFEKQFYRSLKEKLIPLASSLGSLMFQLTEAAQDNDGVKKITALLESFEPTFDLLAEACAISLDPGTRLGIDAAWVQDNLSSWRIWNIVLAQVNVNRLRDFFYQLFQGSQIPGTINRAGIRR